VRRQVTLWQRDRLADDGKHPDDQPDNRSDDVGFLQRDI